MDEANGVDPDGTTLADLEGVPEVEELQERLRRVDAAMALLQAGDLDAAEAAINELREKTYRTPAEASADDEPADDEPAVSDEEE